MNSTLGTHRFNRGLILFVAAIATAIILVYDYLYYFWPLPDYWNQLFMDLLTVLLAGAATTVGIFLTRQFDRGEAPRRVWFWFTVGWCAWFTGELVGTGYDLLNISTYPDFTLFDACWIAGYFFFGLSLYNQYRLIYSGDKRYSASFYFAVVAIMLVITLGLTQLAIQAGLGEGKDWFAVYLAVLYPVCDVVEGIAAIWLSLLFGRGRWGRPWWSLIAFAVADSISILYWLGGLNNLPEKTQEYLNLFSDTAYNAGYVILLLSFLSLFLLLSHPPAPTTQTSQTANEFPGD
jgi:hypothetical protein